MSDQLPGARGRGLGAAAGVNVEWQTRARWRVSHPTRAKTGRRGRSGTGPQRARFRWTREQMSASAFIRCRVGCSDAPSRDRRRGGRTPQKVLSLLGGRSWDQGDGSCRSSAIPWRDVRGRHHLAAAPASETATARRVHRRYSSLNGRCSTWNRRIVLAGIPIRMRERDSDRELSTPAASHQAADPGSNHSSRQGMTTPARVRRTVRTQVRSSRTRRRPIRSPCFTWNRRRMRRLEYR